MHRAEVQPGPLTASVAWGSPYSHHGVPWLTHAMQQLTTHFTTPHLTGGCVLSISLQCVGYVGLLGGPNRQQEELTVWRVLVHPHVPSGQ